MQEKNFLKNFSVICCCHCLPGELQLWREVQAFHNPHRSHYNPLFRYLQSHLVINLATPPVFAHQSGTANKILLRNCQCKSKLIVYLEPEYNRNKLRFIRVIYKKCSGAKFSGPNITNSLEFTWITTKFSNKQLVRKKFRPYWDVIERNS